MCKLTVIITHKGKEYIRTFEDDNITMDYNITVLLSNKDSCNNYGLARYHYICKLYNGTLLIPETTILPHETAFINIKLNGNEFRVEDRYLCRNWKLPLHTIGCQCDVFPLDGNYSIEL